MQRTLILSFLLLWACSDDTSPLRDASPMDGGASDAGSADGALEDAGPDAMVADGGQADAQAMDASADGGPRPDAGPIGPLSCDPAMPADCDDNQTQWYRSFGDCAPRMGCPGTGYVSLGECRRAHAHCEGPELCGSLPSFVIEECAEEGFAWDGSACVAGCDYLSPSAQIYSTLQECEHVHQSCGAEGGCGPVLPLGCTRLDGPFATVFSDANHDTPCDGAEGWDLQAIFVAPDDEAYQVRVQVETPGEGRGALVSVSPGICSTREMDTPATHCVDYDEPAAIPARSWRVDAESHRAHTIRISPRAFPDEFTSLTVCVDRAAE